MPATRRLAAILAADVAGYSRLIGADEQGTLERLRAIRTELINPSIAAYNGRIVKTTGDGLLAEFASSVDALRCATEVQAAMAERNAESSGERRIEFRIGIHQGDIVVEDGDIFGDGVNITARLEGLAQPGAICISGRVHEDAAGKLDLAFRDLGDQQLKNIARPLRVYAIDLGTVPRPAPTTKPVPRLSIVVLPFANLNDDPEITEDLTTDLSRIPHSFVISRNTAFTYRNTSVNTKRVGGELGVRYVLEESVRRLGDRLRVSAQLIDAETDAHLWAERFDRNIGDLFTLQREITGQIAVTLSMELLSAEAARPTDNPDVLEYILRARAAFLKPSSRGRYPEVIRLLERALELDPRSVAAQSYLAASLMARVVAAMSDAPAADIGRAQMLADQALAASPRNPLAHYAKGQLLRAQGRYAEAIPYYESALASDRNWTVALNGLGHCKLQLGSLEEVIPLFEQAISLSPRDPELGVWYSQIGFVHLLQSRIDEAIQWLEKARVMSPEPSYIHAFLASAYGLKGQTERAVAELARARTLASDDRYSSLARLRAIRPAAALAIAEATYLAGLRNAGMPEE